ncbi:unnamed protein product [Pylaiella littoralis]
MCMCIYSGNFGRSEYARKKGLDKKAGYITSADDSKLEELMDILRFFEKWRCNLEEKTTLGDVTWKKHFITEYSWTDIRVSILGFVSMCRYLFEDDSRFKVSRLRDTPRYVNPRHHCQDVVENRFGHMRDGLGSHRNPTATQAKERAARGDLNRSLHGRSRANHNRNARRGQDYIASGYRARIMLPITEGERSATMRPSSWNTPAAVLFPRYISYDNPYTR